MRRDPDELPAAAAGYSGMQAPTRACKADDGLPPAARIRQHSGINVQEGSHLGTALGRRANSADAHGEEEKRGGVGEASARVRLCATQETSHKALQYISLRKKKKQQPVILHKFAARPQVQASDLLLTRRLGCPNKDAEGEF